MKVMITGGDGFVGSHLQDYLARECGHLCGVFDIANGFDITDADQVQWFFDTFKPVIVYHLAAQINPKKSEEDRRKDWEINVQGTLNIIDCMVKNPVANVLVFSSSDAVVNPISNYGVSKRAAEEYILKYTRQGKLQGKIARFSSIYGHGRFGRGVINRFIEKAKKGEPLTVYGTGASQRDFTHVSDCVRALELIQRDGQIGGVYNVGTGIQHKVRDVANLISLLGDVDVELMEVEDNEVFGSDFDTSELAKLGFVARKDIYKGILDLFSTWSP